MENRGRDHIKGRKQLTTIKIGVIGKATPSKYVEDNRVNFLNSDEDIYIDVVDEKGTE